MYPKDETNHSTLVDMIAYIALCSKSDMPLSITVERERSGGSQSQIGRVTSASGSYGPHIDRCESTVSASQFSTGDVIEVSVDSQEGRYREYFMVNGTRFVHIARVPYDSMVFDDGLEEDPEMQWETE